LQAIFRNLWIFLAGEVLLLGVALQSESSLVSKLTGPDGIPENAQEIISVSRSISTGALVAAVLFVIVMVGLSAWAILRDRRRELVIGDSELALPDSDTPIPFDRIVTIVFMADPFINDAVLIEGVTADAENAANTTLEVVGFTAALLSPGPVDKNALPLPAELGEITRFHHIPQNEAVAAELASRVSSVRPAARILTLVNRFRKQRVVWRKAGQ
jgi:hypothetical protein